MLLLLIQLVISSSSFASAATLQEQLASATLNPKSLDLWMVAPTIQKSMATSPLNFKSVWVEAQTFTDSELKAQTLFRSALFDTLVQTQLTADGTAFVKTGDIPAQWLRDSSVQVRPYLYLASSDPAVASLIKAVIQRQALNLIQDPYANAFKVDYKVWEEKFELDSLCYPILLAWDYWKITNDATVFTPEVKQAFTIVLKTMQTEQDHPGKSRYTNAKLHGKRVGATGMIWSGFRPSDDPCIYNFLIPSEMQAVEALAAMKDIAQTVFNDSDMSAQAAKLRQDVNDGIKKFGIVQNQKFGKMYAYEVDGLGNSKLMDDANIPSLLSAPYLGYLKESDPIYQATRRFILSKSNPYYFQGTKASGVGSPHTPLDFVWPLSLIAQGLTTTISKEKDELIQMLVNSDPGDGLLHESLDVNNQYEYTRSDFGWPNALFVEFMLINHSGKTPLPVPSADDL